MALEITVESDEGLRVVASGGRHRLTIDEPEAQGGSDQGMSPKQAFLVSIATCGVITMRMYAQRKGWKLEHARVKARLEEGQGGGRAKVVQEIELQGELGEAERVRLKEIAGRCPVHRMVSGGVDFEEVLAG